MACQHVVEWCNPIFTQTCIAPHYFFNRKIKVWNLWPNFESFLHKIWFPVNYLDFRCNIDGPPPYFSMHVAVLQCIILHRLWLPFVVHAWCTQNYCRLLYAIAPTLQHDILLYAVHLEYSHPELIHIWLWWGPLPSNITIGPLYVQQWSIIHMKKNSFIYWSFVFCVLHRLIKNNWSHMLTRGIGINQLTPKQCSDFFQLVTINNAQHRHIVTMWI